jgi:hypothetical protein
MTTALRVYNGALRLLGERRLTSTSEARDARYHLDDAYTDVKALCLEQGYWNFAMRAVSMTSSSSITVSFGYEYAFEKPTDWVRTYIVSDNEMLEQWTTRFNEEAGIWYADTTPLYARYVSNSTSYGYDLTLWTQAYAEYVEAELAIAIAPTVSSMSSEKMEMLVKARDRARAKAMAHDAMDEPPVGPPLGSWVRSRGGNQHVRSLATGMRFY